MSYLFGFFDDLQSDATASADPEAEESYSSQPIATSFSSQPPSTPSFVSQPPQAMTPMGTPFGSPRPLTSSTLMGAQTSASAPASAATPSSMMMMAAAASPAAYTPYAGFGSQLHSSSYSSFSSSQAPSQYVPPQYTSQSPMPQSFMRKMPYSGAGAGSSSSMEPEAKRYKAAAAAAAAEGEEDEDIKEVNTKVAEEDSTEVAKAISNLQYDGTEFKKDAAKLTNIIASGEPGAVLPFSSAPPATPAAAVPVSVVPTPAVSVGVVRQQQQPIFDYNVKVTNVVSKVTILDSTDKAVVAAAAAAAENAENTIANGETIGTGRRGGRGKSRQAKKPSLLSLSDICDKLQNVKYTNRFSAARVTMKEPKATGLVFGCGTVVCTGTKTIAENKDASKRLARAIKKVTGLPVSFKNYTVVNMTATVDVHFRINLNALSRNLPNGTVTQPLKKRHSHFFVVSFFAFNFFALFYAFCI